MQIDAAWRHTTRDQECLDFAECVCGRSRVGSVDRYVGGDRARGLVSPDLRQPYHVGALFGGKTAARMTDEDHDRLVGLLYRDRMP